MEKKSTLANKVQEEFVKQSCAEYGIDVYVPKDLYEQSRKEQQKNIKQDHYFPGGYISPHGQVFSGYNAFHDYTQ